MTIPAAYGHRRGLALLASLSLVLLAAPAAYAGCHCGTGCAIDSSWLGGAYTGPIAFCGTAARLPGANEMELTVGGRLVLEKNPAAAIPALRSVPIELWPREAAALLTGVAAAGASDFVNAAPLRAARTALSTGSPELLTAGFVAVNAADFVNVQAFYTVRDIRTASAALPEGVSEALFVDTGTMSAGAWTRRP